VPKAPFAAIPGSPPAGVIPAGCPFHPRCEFVHAPCSTRMPDTTVVSDEHAAACHLLEGVG
jgi:oligopeptide/dipeptide ABC transporter ATP-binding protein